MSTPLKVGLIGDHDPALTAHRAIPRALALAAEATGCTVDPTWVATESITNDDTVSGFDALWCVPGSPYRSMEGALEGIGFARAHGKPFLGTCGGFQHALIEFAREALRWTDAGHAESPGDPGAGTARMVVTPLACALVEATGVVRFRGGSRLAAAYGSPEANEAYHCSYGLNPAFREALLSGPLRVAATDTAGEVRGIELDGHPFFVATLFQPERAALAGRVPPIVAAFLRAAAAVPRPRRKK